ncbi:hypothetical protein GPECTOR_11g258 [Gonium pectorale]|uniref:Aminotransferase class I/classII large domain-containing protein n=1 Tax=Gonium pectorale TaxID=33097 RepID=A0A150GPQ5_GONPE|nr:hypothetical protein GPECTOR_11g258 [Gonium pectorale]|eukprot:KXZ51817.1 hypothetical protein GPECTOR_11g258 [Gonium pectorale]
MDYERFLSSEARRFTHASLAGLVHRFSGVEGVISLAGGLPPPEAFPLSCLAATTRDGLQLSLGEEGQQAYLAQQYNFNPQGYGPLLEWLRDLSVQQHGIAVPGKEPSAASLPGPPPGPQRDVVLASGAIHAIFAAISCLTDPGDTLVVDEYTYTHALECVFLPRGLRLLPVRGDEQGMDPEHLEEQLRAAEEAAEAGSSGGDVGPVRRPRLLYCIPTGHNPTGAVMGEQRKRDILRALYAARADSAHRAASEHLSGLAEWRPVRAGMFMWLQLTGVPDVSAILDDLVAAKVVVVPGSMFATTGLPVGGPHLRLSFAGATPEVLAEGLRRLAEATRAVVARREGAEGAQCG